MSAPIDDGGRAFPGPDAVYPNGQIQYGSTGMTLREYYAGRAMQAILTEDGLWDASEAAARSVAYADALIKALKE